MLPRELTEALPGDHGGGHVIHVCPLGVRARELREDAVNLVWGMDRYRLDRRWSPRAWDSSVASEACRRSGEPKAVGLWSNATRETFGTTSVSTANCFPYPA